MERKTVKISDVAKVGRGSSPRPITDPKFFCNGTIPWIKIADATASGKYIYETREHVNEYGASFSRLLPAGSLIIAASGTLGFPKFLGVSGCIHDGWMYFSNIHNVDIDYFYYYLITLRDYFNNLSYGAAIQNINTPIINNTKISLPPIYIQERIVDILSKYDELIEVNNQRIKKLEQTAEELYKEWFVRFRFPNYQNTEFENGIPKGWEKSPLGEHATIKRGGSPRPIQDFLSDDGLNWLKISDVTSVDGAFIFEIKEKIIEDGLNKTIFLQKDSLVLSNSATPGIPKILAIDSCIHDGWLYFPESYFSNEFLYLLFKYERPNIARLGNGAVFTNLKTDLLKSYSVIVPSKEVLSSFQDIIFPVFEEMKRVQIMNMNLIKQRDLLLPRLMSGKLEV